MRRGFPYVAVFFAALISSLCVFAQSVTITGKIISTANREGIGSVSVTVKGSGEGTFTDPNGNFKLTVKQLPVTLVISSVGFDQQEVTVSNATDVLNVSLNPASALGQEVVVSATRTPQRSPSRRRTPCRWRPWAKRTSTRRRAAGRWCWRPSGTPVR